MGCFTTGRKRIGPSCTGIGIGLFGISETANEDGSRRISAAGFSNTGFSITGFSNTGFSITGFSNTGLSVTGFSNTGFSIIDFSTTGFNNIGFLITGISVADPSITLFSIAGISSESILGGAEVIFFIEDPFPGESGVSFVR